MISDESMKREYYQALVERDSAYDGIFFVGIKTTGVFCHATCPARKPNYENCLFYKTAEEALLAGFRPCKRCRPLSFPQGQSPLVQRMVALVEENPEKRWKDSDFRELGIHAATARRQFKKNYNMTFVQYARARRMGIAMKSIRTGEKIINAQIDLGYTSSSGFHDAFSKIMGRTPNRSQKIKMLYANWIDTPLGPMVSIVDEDFLYLLEFADRRGLEREIERLRNRLNASIIPGVTDRSKQIENELNDYFNKGLGTFKTPIMLLGSDFQRSVWEQLITIEMGKTATYKELAGLIGNPKAVRAIGNANGANQLAIIVTCHRVIQSGGALGGYGGGVERKRWLLAHEQSAVQRLLK
ncbi:trifunctional transcriptional activator/DNA repair protein Ada/methylated-DNA--[protein]-cysteine S-methyltransferase [Sporolactobacillus sp. CPB3-1]|uniref:Trifunctional transcriptional activator/DNA repair protein Ada/methylated-DNA--[protein]-cysteine S-methyltransferase n=1 Tax=Sporolactobacillus mangiferae TaxID=2940498 RepID=A0ABT0M9D7_9BACL|nr:trifunctional transcriptional activator/DNA repair protein Ada/methylated-DNA--[protein]-cysteine S-methyltransferase [Sporolactobacillus mangiferae]MCL1631490.1 trifunctional transcriptional activator/DNA repair protein Ada/methylated-DNA--[protein]-cysteine S-methyltransferase [Sporolactobacillus mangiferae]